MREMIVTIITLLHKYKRFWTVNLELVASLGLVSASYLLDCFDLTYGSICLLVMVTWEISDVLLFERKAIVENELADTKDKLCLSEHKVEHLTSELETTQAALLRVKKQMDTTRQKEVNIAEDVSADESSDKEVAPKPKRKPAPRGTRKPKTKNENKD